MNDHETRRVLSEILVGQIKTHHLLEQIMATIDEVAADVAAESTLIDGVSTLISGLQEQLAAALKNASIPPEVQAQIDKVFANAETNKSKLSVALASNTPTPVPAPAPAPAPAV